jgi:hypothetical protein
MNSLENPMVGQYESVFTQYDVIKAANGKSWLQISLHGRSFDLPLVNVGTEEQTSAIGWLDPHPERNPLLAQAAANAMNALLSDIPVQIVVMPTSSKSEWFIEEAVRRLSQNIPLIKLPGGKDRSAVEKVCAPGSVMEYTAVTGKKYIGATEGQIELLKKNAPDGKGIVICDDVRTLGGTLDGIQKLLGPVLHGRNPLKVVLAREADLDEDYPPFLENGFFASIALPDMKGIFPPDTLIPISKRNEIPPAIVR